MKENQKEMNPKSKKVILIVVILLIALVTGVLIWASRNFDFRQTSNGEVNINSGESGNSDELSEEEKWDESLEVENYWDDEMIEGDLQEEINQYSGEKIEEAEFETDGIKVSNINIEVLEGSTDITAEIQNKLDKKINSVTLNVKLYNANEELLYDYSMVISDMEANELRNVQTNIGAIFTEFENIYVEATELDIEE